MFHILILVKTLLVKVDVSIVLRSSSGAGNISQLLSKNYHGPIKPVLKRNHIVYCYTCPHEDCALQKESYIGQSVTTLSCRITMHLANGGPQQHSTTVHKQKLTSANMVENTIILHHEPKITKLSILEALAIKNCNPSINRQCTGNNCILKLFT